MSKMNTSPGEGELPGSLHTERKRREKEKCRCTSGQKEDLTWPLLLPPVARPRGCPAQRVRARPEREEVRARVQKRRRRLEREGEERAEWTSQGEGNGQPRGYWKRENRSSPMGQVQRLLGTLDAVL